MSRSLTGSLPERKIVETDLGPISYLESGSGPPAVFIHGLFLNANLWEHQLAELGDLRTCLAPDLLAHGASAVPHAGTLDIRMQVEMMFAFLDALGLEQVDLVGCDSGGAIAQLIAVRASERVRSLTLTNSEAHDNWPPKNFTPIHDMADQGLLAESLVGLSSDPQTARAVLSTSFERPGELSDDVIRGFFGPFADPARATAVQDYVVAMDSSVTVSIESDLRKLLVPTLIVWGAADEFFDVKWAHWLAKTIPGTVRRVVVDGAMLFHAAERPEVLNRELRDLWSNAAAHRVLSDYLRAWNSHDLDAVMGAHTDDTVFDNHIGAVAHIGREQVLKAFESDLAQWPDVRWEPIRRIVAEDFCILESRMHATAASKLEALGFVIEAGSEVEGVCVDWLTLRGGQVARKDTFFDVVELLSSAQGR